MNPSIFDWERRDYKQVESVDWDRVWFYIAFISSIVAGVLVLGLFLPKAHAQEFMSYKDVHTEHEACVYLHQHPGSIKNVTWCDL